MGIREVRLQEIGTLRSALFSGHRDPEMADFMKDYLSRKGTEMARRSPPLAQEALLFGMVHIPFSTYTARELPAYASNRDEVMMISDTGHTFLRRGVYKGQPFLDLLSSLGYHPGGVVHFPDLGGRIAETVVAYSRASQDLRAATGQKGYQARDPSLPGIDILSEIFIPGRRDQTLRIVP